jgi:hypothetical protein
LRLLKTTFYAAASLTLLVAVLAIGFRVTTQPRCNAIPGHIAVCVDGNHVSWEASVKKEYGDYYGPVEDLASTLGARAVVSSDKRQVTINGKALSSSGGVTNTREFDGKLYVIILDAANAAGYNVGIDFVRGVVGISRQR